MTVKKTAELEGPALDWAIAKCEGVEVDFIDDCITRCLLRRAPLTGRYSPSTDWSKGGPLIEREGINVGTQRNEPGFRPHPNRLWHAQMDTRVHVGYGPTPLIAAMRCFVASRLGDDVDVPEELL